VRLPRTTRHSNLFERNSSIASGISCRDTGNLSVQSNSVQMENTSPRHVLSLYLGTLLMVAADKLIKLWNARTGEFVQNFEGHTKGISDVAWSSASDLIASASDDKTVRLWNVTTVLTLMAWTNFLAGRMC